jgi:hypothetical protein
MHGPPWHAKPRVAVAVIFPAAPQWRATPSIPSYFMKTGMLNSSKTWANSVATTQENL